MVVPIWPSHALPDGTIARSALIGRSDGAIVAYANVCRHLAVPLDYGDGDVTDEDGEDLRCRHHGAVFAAASGQCVVGPCQGRSLWRFTVEVDGAGDATLLVGGEVLPDGEDS